MPKKLFAVTNLKFSGDGTDFIAAGSEVDTSKFSKEQLVELHDAGAVEVRIVDNEPKEKDRLSPLDDPDVEVKDETAAAKVKAAKEEADAKKDAIDAEVKAQADAEKEAVKAAEMREADAKAADAKAAKEAEAADKATATPTKATPAAATTKPEDKK